MLDIQISISDFFFHFHYLTSAVKTQSSDSCFQWLLLRVLSSQRKNQPKQTPGHKGLEVPIIITTSPPQLSLGHRGCMAPVPKPMWQGCWQSRNKPLCPLPPPKRKFPADFTACQIQYETKNLCNLN